MVLSFLPLGLAAAVLAAPPDSGLGDPHAIVRQAQLAVAGDSAAALRARWSARLARDSSDRAALLGVATLARLTYDYPLAERLYRRLYSGPADRFAVYARLGLGQGFDEYGRMHEADGLLARARSDARTLDDPTAEAEALLWLASVRARSHGLETGIALLDSALWVVPGQVPALRAAVLCRRAHLLILTGAARARAELEAATQLVRGTGEPRAEAPCVRARAIELERRGESDSARWSTAPLPRCCAAHMTGARAHAISRCAL